VGAARGRHPRAPRPDRPLTESTAESAAEIDAAVGLTAAQVAERVAAGQVNAVKDRNARSLGDIVRANTFTYFNALIGSLWVLMLVSAPLIDSLFGLVIVVNTAIGIVQEYCAARTLSKLSARAPAAGHVLRDGDEQCPAQRGRPRPIVVSTGDQMLVDSVVVSQGLGSTSRCSPGGRPGREAGDDVLSGRSSWPGRCGARPASARLLRRPARRRGEQVQPHPLRLRDSIQRFIKYVSFALIPVGILLFVRSGTHRRQHPGSIGARSRVITMVPEGLSCSPASRWRCR
jgi:cation-transporting ATPase E